MSLVLVAAVIVVVVGVVSKCYDEERKASIITALLVYTHFE